jgi:hypothetical protein
MFDNFHSALTTPFTAGYAEKGDKINLRINNPLNGGCLDIRRHPIDSVTKSKLSPMTREAGSEPIGRHVNARLRVNTTRRVT